jgi:hypothetical protein
LTDPAPICLFVYNRPDHTKEVLKYLARNQLAEQSDLFVFSDGPAGQADESAVAEVRNLICSVKGFRTVSVIERQENLGLASSIISGVTEVCHRHGRVIVVEDDLVTSPHFLLYMNQALDRFADSEQVASIHGYVYPVQEDLPEAFFLRGADCWGWATWKRAWALFNPDGRQLLDELQHRRLLKAFDFNGAFPFSKMLRQQIRGENDSWAIRWYASAFLMNRLCLYPGRSLVLNIGTDSSGIHSEQSDRYDVSLNDIPVDLSGVKIEPCKVANKAFENFFRQTRQGVLSRLLTRFGNTLRRVLDSD